MMTVLVTGGAGFIGSHFVKFFQQRHPHAHVIVLDSFTYAGNSFNLYSEDVDLTRLEIYEGSITSSTDLSKVFNGRVIDSVFNFAAESHNDRAIANPSQAMETNFMGVFHLLEAARLNKVRRFVQVSTDEVYGTTSETFTEYSLLKPNQPYSAAKAGAEHIVRSYAKTFGMNTLVTRGSNTYGTHQYPEKFIPLLVTNALEGKTLPVYGDGLQVREWMHVEDHCSGIYTAWLNGASGHVYNVGSGVELTNIEVVNIIQDILSPYTQTTIEYVKDRPGHDVRYSLDSSKLINLGWKPIRKFSQGIVETVNWYVQNESWWKPLKSNKDFVVYAVKKD